MKANRYQTSVSIEEIALNTTGKHQYNSTTANYSVPTTDAYMERKDRYLTQWSKEKNIRNTYVDQIFLHAKNK